MSLPISLLSPVTPNFTDQSPSSSQNNTSFGTPPNFHSALKSWREIRDLKLLNLYYDVTPSKFVSMVISEVGLIPSTSAPTVLREPNFGLGLL